MKNRTLLGTLLVITGTLAFAFNVIMAPFLYRDGSDPLTMIMVRSTGFSIVLSIVLALTSHPIKLAPWPRYASLGIGVLFTVQSLCFFTAISRIPVSIGTLVEYTYPFHIAVALRVLYGEPLSGYRILTMLGAFTGLVLVLGAPGVGEDIDRVGLTLMIVASFLLSTKLLLTHRILTTVDTPRMTLHMSAMVGLVCVGTYLLTPFEPAWPHSAEGWTLLALAPVSNLVGVLTFYRGLAMIGPGRTSMLASAEPVFILILAALLLGETLSSVQLLGAGVVVLAVTLFQLERRRV